MDLYDRIIGKPPLPPAAVSKLRNQIEKSPMRALSRFQASCDTGQATGSELGIHRRHDMGLADIVPE
jgi:hypothetical protein